MKKYLVGLLASIMALVTFAPAALAEAETAAPSEWTPIGIGILMGFAVMGGAMGQGRAVAATIETIGRNPSVAGKAQMVMILGLALIESLVLFGLAIVFSKM